MATKRKAVKEVPPEDRVETPSVAYTAQKVEWDMTEALRGGTFTMRDAGHTYLPPFPKEDPLDYHHRLHNSFLFPKYGDTVESLGSKPFSKPVLLTTKKGLDPRLSDIENNVDKTGTDLTQFCKTVFTEGIDKGISFVLVDYPQMSPLATLADERKVGARPIFVHYKAQDLIGCKYVKAENGDFRLTQVRLHECRLEDVGLFGDQEVEYIRVINLNDWQLWRKYADDKNYSLVTAGVHSFGDVPVVPLYITKTGFMTGKPALKYLAELNLAHWQSYSDQRNFLRFARIGILFATGFPEDELEKVVVAPNRLVKTTSETAKLAYVEHTGQAVGAGRDDLKDLEKEMEIVGAQPLMEKGKSGGASATGRAIDEARTQADIQAWIRSAENFVQQLYVFAGKWVGATIPDDFKVDIFSDFVTSLRPSEEIASLVQAAVANKITTEVFLTEMKRRGLLSDFVDIPEMVKQLDALDAQTKAHELALIAARPAAKPPTTGNAAA